jgi:hypothetical protein
MKHTSHEREQPRLEVVASEPTSPAPPSELETHLARLEFAEALGRRSVGADPNIFERTFVGRWPSIEHFVNDFITESGMVEALDVLPARLRPFVTIDRLRVMEDLRRELLVVPVGEPVWVFDAAADVVNSTVSKSERLVHTEMQDDATNPTI